MAHNRAYAFKMLQHLTTTSGHSRCQLMKVGIHRPAAGTASSTIQLVLQGETARANQTIGWVTSTDKFRPLYGHYRATIKLG